MFNVTRGRSKAQKHSAPAGASAGWRSPIETDSSSRPGEDDQFTAESAGVISENDVNVKPTRANQMLLLLKIRHYGVRQQQD
jgi:hypothetical protein